MRSRKEEEVSTLNGFRLMILSDIQKYNAEGMGRK